MQEKTTVVVSSLVDATIREYSPDTEFLIFKLPNELGKYVSENPIRANNMFITEEILGATNTSIQYIKDIITNNGYVSVDKVIFIVTENSVHHKAVKYLIEQFSLTNWELIVGTISKAYVTEVINGTYRNDNITMRRKVVYRVPRSDYVKDELNTRESLQDPYEDDDNDLMDIADEEMPIAPVPTRTSTLRKFHIVGQNCAERTAFAFVSAQYLALSGKTIIVESDVDYHTVTDYATKSGADYYLITISELYDNLEKALSNIIKSEHNLVVVGTVDRIDFSYQFITDLLYYNLSDYVDCIVCESSIDNIPCNCEFTLVIPSTLPGILYVSDNLDRAFYRSAMLVGVNLKHLPQTHVNSGQVMSTLLRDLLSDNSVVCPVVTLSSLKLNGSAYDLGGILGGGTN